MDFGKTRVRDPINKYYNDRIQNVNDILKKVGVPVLPINTADEIIAQLQTLLGYAILKR